MGYWNNCAVFLLSFNFISLVCFPLSSDVKDKLALKPGRNFRAIQVLNVFISDEFSHLASNAVAQWWSFLLVADLLCVWFIIAFVSGLMVTDVIFILTRSLTVLPSIGPSGATFAVVAFSVPRFLMKIPSIALRTKNDKLMFSGFVLISVALVVNGVAVLYDKPRSRREHLSGLFTGLFILALQMLVGFYLS